ncbi:MAG: hypothetical protein QME88_06820 [Actinomycetota bacterium]|nr:hypothetical protein [Actinomycetota bacterium]
MRNRYYSQYLMRVLDGEDLSLDRELSELVRLGERVKRVMPVVPPLEEAARARIWESAVSGAVAPVPRERRMVTLPRAAWIAAAACLIAVAAVFALFLLRGGAPTVTGRVEVASLHIDRGEVTVRDGEGNERPAVEGKALAEGDTVIAARGARGWMEFGSGSILRLQGDTEVALVEGEEGVEVEVVRGRTYHRVAEGTRYLARSGGVSVNALGTAFMLDVEDGRGRVLSIHSAVKVVTGGEPGSSLDEGDALDFFQGGIGEPYDITREHLDDEWIRWNKALDEELGLPVGILRLLEEAAEEEKTQEEPPREPSSPQPAPPQPQPSPQPAPQPPVQKSVTLAAAAREGAVDFTWTLTGYSGFQGFKLCRSETNPAPSYPGDWWKYIDGEGTRSVTDTSVEGGRTYYYRLAVYDRGEVLGYSNAVQVTVPGKKQELSICLSAAVEGGKAVLSWEVSGTGSYSGFKLCRSETNPAPSYPGDTCTFVDAGSRSYADTSVSSGHAYYYRVGIYRDGSILAYSNAVKVVVP